MFYQIIAYLICLLYDLEIKNIYIPGPEGESVIIEEHPDDPTPGSVGLCDVLLGKKCTIEYPFFD